MKKKYCCQLQNISTTVIPNVFTQKYLACLMLLHTRQKLGFRGLGENLLLLFVPRIFLNLFSKILLN